jgi:Icc-related predicted phosphoesterase
MKYNITFISDTHGKHKQITSDLTGGDVIICSGDISSMGHEHEIREFLSWFSRLSSYTNKIFIAGNHDWGFQDNVEKVKKILSEYPNVIYLQDDLHLLGEDDDNYEDRVKIWGSPWQPEFYNWAFNLPRNSPEMWSKWLLIPENTDILITHGPPSGILDQVDGRWDKLGCEMLMERVNYLKPKIHVFGHIHSGYGYRFHNNTHFINAAVLGENYTYRNKPVSVIWDNETNNIEFI